MKTDTILIPGWFYLILLDDSFLGLRWFSYTSVGYSAKYSVGQTCWGSMWLFLSPLLYLSNLSALVFLDSQLFLLSYWHLLASAWVLLPVLWSPAISWDKARAHLLLSQGFYCPLLPDIQCLKHCCLVCFVCCFCCCSGFLGGLVSQTPVTLS